MIGLQIKELSFSYLNGLVLNNINLSIKAGEMVGLLGANGSGKTTLIKLATGILKPLRGEIRLNDTDIAQLSRKFIARHVAVVPQQLFIPFAYTVREVVGLGRTPFVKALSGESGVDRTAINNALDTVGMKNLEERHFDELSGGERQKVILAMALAQQPKMLLLDEPLVHLDITHQVEMLELVKSLNREQGITIIAAIHDLNLASLYFDRLVLLKKGEILADGTPSQVITEEGIREAFSASVSIGQHPTVNVPHVIVTPRDRDNNNGT